MSLDPTKRKKRRRERKPRKPYTKCPDPRGPIGDAVVRAARAGESFVATERKLGITLGHIQKIAEARGAVFRSKHGRTEAFSRAQLLRASKALDLEEARQILWCTGSFARRALTKAGLRVPPDYGKVRVSLEDALRALETDGTFTTAGKVLGCDSRVVSIALMRAAQAGSREARAWLTSPHRGRKRRRQSEEFGERFRLLLARAGVKKIALGRRLAAALGQRTASAWVSWFEQRALGFVPAATVLAQVLAGARFRSPATLIPWLLGEKKRNPLAKGWVTAEPEPPPPGRPDRARALAAFPIRMKQLRGRMGLSCMGFARLVHALTPRRTVYGVTWRLNHMERGVFDQFLLRQGLAALLADGGVLRAGEAAAWLYGERVAAPWGRGAPVLTARARKVAQALLQGGIARRR
jgi:hypothetical protein